MNLKQIKKEVLEYRDFYGGDIPQIDLIKDAKTKEEIKNILHQYSNHLEDQLRDALSHLDQLKRKLGLF